MPQLQMHCPHISCDDVADIVQVRFDSDASRRSSGDDDNADYLLLQRNFEIEDIDWEITGKRSQGRCNVECGVNEMCGYSQIIQSASLTRDRFTLCYGDDRHEVIVSFEADDTAYSNLSGFLRTLIPTLEIEPESWVTAALNRMNATISLYGPGEYNWRVNDHVLQIAPAVTQVRGGRHDGEEVYPLFRLEVSQFIAIFDKLPEINWSTMEHSMFFEGTICGELALVELLGYPFKESDEFDGSEDEDDFDD